MPSDSRMMKGGRKTKRRAVQRARARRALEANRKQEALAAARDQETTDTSDDDDDDDDALYTEAPTQPEAGPGRERPSGGLQNRRNTQGIRYHRLKLIGMLIVCVWSGLLMYSFSGFDFSLLLKLIEISHRIASGRPEEIDAIQESLKEFFFPKTCTLREDQDMKPCGEQLNITEHDCLKLNCCYIASETNKCFAPVGDEQKQMIRAFVAFFCGALFLVWLPTYFRYLVQRSRHENNLRMREMLARMRRQRRRARRGLAVSDNEDDGKNEQETRVFLHR